MAGRWRGRGRGRGAREAAASRWAARQPSRQTHQRPAGRPGEHGRPARACRCRALGAGQQVRGQQATHQPPMRGRISANPDRRMTSSSIMAAERQEQAERGKETRIYGCRGKCVSSSRQAVGGTALAQPGRLWRSTAAAGGQQPPCCCTSEQPCMQIPEHVPWTGGVTGACPPPMPPAMVMLGVAAASQMKSEPNDREPRHSCGGHGGGQCERSAGPGRPGPCSAQQRLMSGEAPAQGTQQGKPAGHSSRAARAPGAGT